jgi:hypothetical protein
MRPREYAYEMVFSRVNKTVQESDSRVEVRALSIQNAYSRLEIPITSPPRNTVLKVRNGVLL